MDTNNVKANRTVEDMKSMEKLKLKIKMRTPCVDTNKPTIKMRKISVERAREIHNNGKGICPLCLKESVWLICEWKLVCGQQQCNWGIQIEKEPLLIVPLR